MFNDRLTTLRWALAALITYGSLYPFDFAMPLDVSRDLAVLFDPGSVWTSPGDVLGNILLFLPWGALASLPPEFPRVSRRNLAVGIGLALALQIAQLALPSRDAVLADVVWNIAGILLGQWLLAPLRLRLDQPDAGAARPIGPALFIAALWLFSELLPLVPSIDWAAIKGQLRQLTNGGGGVAMALLGGGAYLFFAHAVQRHFDSRRALLIVIGTLPLLCAAKLLIPGAAWHLASVIGWSLGALAALWIAPRSARRADALVVGTLLGGWTLMQLAPYQLSAHATDFNWLPFVGHLSAGMLGNLGELLTSVWVFAALLWSARRLGAPRNAMTLLLVVWVLLLEVAQKWLPGRSPDITDVLLVGLLAWFLPWRAPVRRRHRRAEHRADTPIATPATPATAATPASPDADERAGRVRTALIGMAAFVAVGTAALAWLIRQPQVPYNVRELFLGDGSTLAIAMFCLALVWLGGGVYLAVRAALRATASWRRLPFTLLGAGLVMLLLLTLSVTDESLMDIAGSNNLYWWVTNRDIWGSAWKTFFLAWLSPEFVAPLERTVRFLALYLPFAAMLALALTAAPEVRRKLLRGDRLKCLLVLLPLMWLAKAIAFDWSSTDNINELLARDAAFGLGGGVYLYALLVLISANIAINAFVARARTLIVAAMFTIAACVVSWWLLNRGLDPAIEKYGKIFSGAQFLLGPDRATPLPEVTLWLRWSGLYVALQLVGATGIRLVRRVLSPQGSSHPRLPRKARASTRSIAAA